jgi:quercetin dioxygenase-like cupin family protein
MKNIDLSEVLVLKDQVDYLKGQVVSKTLVQNKNISLTLFAFDKEEEISTHESKGDALVTVLDGTGEVTIDDKKYILKEGDSIVMPAKHPHAVYAKEAFKMFLIVTFPEKEDK